MDPRISIMAKSTMVALVIWIKLKFIVVVLCFIFVNFQFSTNNLNNNNETNAIFYLLNNYHLFQLL